jgi:hypothetical protein
VRLQRARKRAVAAAAQSGGRVEHTRMAGVKVRVRELRSRRRGLGGRRNGDWGR